MRLLASPESLAEAIARLRAGLEDDFSAYLTDSTRCGFGGLTELAGAGISYHRASQEIGVVEDVEHLNA